MYIPKVILTKNFTIAKIEAEIHILGGAMQKISILGKSQSILETHSASFK